MKHFLIAPALILIAAIAGAQGSNLCATATPIPSPGTYPGTNVGATASGAGTVGTCTTTGLDVWFTYTVAAGFDGTRVIASTCPPGSTTFDSAVDIFTGPCAAIATSTCSTTWCTFPGGFTGGRALTGSLAVGTVVLIRVRGLGAAETGTFELYVDQTFSAPFGNGTCATAVTIFNGQNTGFDNISEPAGVQAGFAGSCGDGSRDVFFTYTATGTGNTTVRSCFPQAPVPALVIRDSVIAVFETCAGGASIACNDDGCPASSSLNGAFMSSATFPAVTGTTYVIRVSGFSSTFEGTFNLEVVAPGAQLITNNTAAVVGFVDISTTGGTPITGVSDDSHHNIVTTIGNALFPAGKVRLSTNGVAIAGLSGGEIGFTNQSIPGTGIPSNLPEFGTGYLCPFWDDLIPVDGSGSTTLWWQEDAGVLYIMWKDIRHFGIGGAGDVATFELQVFGNPGLCGPSVQFLYPDSVFTGSSSVDNGNSATVGYLSNLFGISNAQFSFNDPNVPTGTVVSIHFPAANLVATSPLGAGSLRLEFLTSACSNQVLTSYVLAVTVNPGGPGSIPLFGLQIPIVELLGELAIGFPYVGALDPSGEFSYGPFGGLPSFTFDALVVGFDAGGAVAGHSNVLSYTIP